MEPLEIKKVNHFEHYKDLEEGKWVKLQGWGNLEKARSEIVKCIELYENEVHSK